MISTLGWIVIFGLGVLAIAEAGVAWANHCNTRERRGFRLDKDREILIDGQGFVIDSWGANGSFASRTVEEMNVNFVRTDVWMARHRT